MFAEVRRVCARRFLLSPSSVSHLLLHLPLAASCSGSPPRKQCDARSCGSPDGVTFFRKQTALPPPRVPSSSRGRKGHGRDTERELVFLSLKYSPAQRRAGPRRPEMLSGAADVFCRRGRNKRSRGKKGGEDRRERERWRVR